MERALAHIEEILELNPIPEADSIEVATIQGWQVVVKKDQFKVGDKVVYFEIDSILPKNEVFVFMEKSKWRVRTIRLRGQVSQGLALPLSDFNLDPALEVGTDLTEPLGVSKYRPPAVFTQQEVKGNFPIFIPKTDTERIQSQPKILDLYHGTEFIAHEKLDGSSITIYSNNGVVGVCSRNLELKEDPNNKFWHVAFKYDLPTKLIELGNVVLQGELIGPSVQENKYKLKELDVRIFDVFLPDAQKYMPVNEAKALVSKLGLEWVPEVYRLVLDSTMTVASLLEIAEGKSALHPDQEREGLVWRPDLEITTRNGRLAFKTISNKFLLKYE